LRGFLLYGSYRLLTVLLRDLPPRIGYRVALWAGWLVYRLSPRTKRVLTHNMSHVLGPNADPDRVQALVRELCVNFAKGHYDLIRLNRLGDDEIKALVQLEGREYIERCLDEGRGVIVVSAHLGNIDVVGQLPLVYGVPATSVVEHIQPERLFQYLWGLRQSHGLTLIPSDGQMLDLFRALKRGEIVVLIGDRAIGDNARSVDLFGSPTHLTDGPVQLAVRTNTTLIPAFVERLPDDTFQVHIEPPLEIPRTGDRSADVAAGMEMVTAVLERYIAKHPEQWMVARPVWPMD
jgi:lauroyl/myristoyl acyltransferase